MPRARPVPDAAKIHPGPRRRPPPALAGACAVPDPPTDLSEAERAVWLELAPQVEEARTFDATLAASFRVMVETVAFSRDRSLSGKLRLDALGKARISLGSWGLSPTDRRRAVGAPAPEDPEAARLRGLLSGNE